TSGYGRGAHQQRVLLLPRGGGQHVVRQRARLGVATSSVLDRRGRRGPHLFGDAADGRTVAKSARRDQSDTGRDGCRYLGGIRGGGRPAHRLEALAGRGGGKGCR